MRTAIIVLFLILTQVAALAERRVALVIGTDRYETLRSLENAVNDARAMETALTALGFEVFSESNRNLRRMRRALEDFEEDADGADVALIFFAGHGVEIEGVNRLLPTDADASSLDTLKETSLPLEEVRQTLARIAPGALIVVDACRNDPFGRSSGSGRGAMALGNDQISLGFGRMGSAENTLYAFATAPGRTASDGDSGNSPFTEALTRHLGTPGLEIRSVLTLVQQDVYERSAGDQLPYVENGLPRLFFASKVDGELPERERLLLAMADLDQPMREQVERIAADADVPLAPLFGALIGADLKTLSVTDREAKLQEAAASFAKVRRELRTLGSGDERVTQLRREAEKQLSLGAFTLARSKLVEAANVDANSREALKANLVERTLSEATTHYLSGSAALSELKYQLAIDDYGKAVGLYDEIDLDDMPSDHVTQQLRTLEASGTVSRIVGDSGAAQDFFKQQIAISSQKAGSNPEDAQWQVEVSAAHDHLGDVLMEQGRWAEALDAYRTGLAIDAKLVEDNPSNGEWQRNLAISHNSVAEILKWQNDLDGALEAFVNGLKITHALAKADQSNAAIYPVMMASTLGAGDVLKAKGDLETAKKIFGLGLNMATIAVKHFPDNVTLERNVSVFHERVGDTLQASGDIPGALQSFRHSLVIAEHLAANDEGHVERQRDVALSHLKIGDVLMAQNDATAAIEAYGNGFTISKNLVKRDPSNMMWQRDLAFFHYRLAKAGQSPEVNLRRALAIGEDILAKGQLAESDIERLELLRDEVRALTK